MNYYVYENWRIDKAIIHEGNCSHCNQGKGVHPNASGKNSTWHGPFATLGEATQAAKAKQREVTRQCGHCLGGSDV